MSPIRCSGKPAGHRSPTVVLLVPALYVTGLGLALAGPAHQPLQRGHALDVLPPQMVSLVVVGVVWQLMTADKIGSASHALWPLGFSRRLAPRRPQLGALHGGFVRVWFLMGFYMLIFLGGLQDIPREYYEAARDRWREP